MGRKPESTKSRPSEGILRAYAQKLYQVELQGESAQHDEAQPDHCGMVNTEVVRPNEVTKCPWGAEKGCALTQCDTAFRDLPA